MTTLKNSFEGGSNGTTITEGNSGGASGDALGFVTGSPTYSNTHAHSGSLSAKITASSGGSLAFEANVTNFWVRFYCWLQANETSSLFRIWSATDTAGSILGAINTDGAGGFNFFSDLTQVNLAGPMSLNQWVRIEAYWSTTGGAELRLYNSADSGTATGSVSTATNITSACLTQEARRSAGLSNDSWYDDLAVSTDGWIGPAVDQPPRAPLTSRTAVHRAASW